MIIKKKLLSAVLSLALALQVGAITLPAMATGEEGETPELTPMEKLWYDTNLLKNGDIELGEIGEDCGPATQVGSTQYWGYYTDNGKNVTAKISDEQAYSKDQSLLIQKNDISWGVYVPFAYESGLKENTTYIGNVKILGTEKNADSTFVNDTNYNSGSAWKVDIFPYFNEHQWSGYTSGGSYHPRDLATAPEAGTAEGSVRPSVIT